MQKPQLGDGLATVTLGDTLVVVWHKGATAARWDWWLAQLSALGAAHPTGALCLDLILAGSSPPDAALRKKAQADFRALGPRLRKLVVVPLGDSIWSSVVRTIVRATLLLSGESGRQVVAASVDEGISRVLAEASGRTPDRAALQQAVADAYQALGVAAAT